MSITAAAAVASPIIKKAAISAVGSLLSKQGKGGEDGKGKENVAAQEIAQNEQAKLAARSKPPSDEEVRQRMQKSLAQSAQNLQKAY